MQKNFILCFYKAVSGETAFKYLSKRSSILLGFEVANRVLTGLTIKESSDDFKKK